MKKSSEQLRSGFTTGACATAAALAAWELFRWRDESCGRPRAEVGYSGPHRPDAGGNVPDVSVLFPDGRDRALPIAGTRLLGHNAAEAWIVKDAGDDPDVTHCAVVRVCLSECRPGAEQSEDFVESCNAGAIILRAGAGVGKVTRRGLEVPPGKWAINPVPRRMIAGNLARAGCGADGRRWLVEIGIDGGAELAARTLNPTLGVIGGLSILGTSGIVVPCSNAAYLATIRVLLRGAREIGCDTAVLATGGRTHRSAQPFYPGLDESAFVRIGDFIREAVAEAAALGFSRIAVACMPGKLAKYARGYTCTHAHVESMAMPDLARDLAEAGLPPAVVEACAGNASVRGFLETLDDATRRTVLDRWAGQALGIWRAWAPQCRFDLLLFELDGRSLGTWPQQISTTTAV